MSGAWLHTGYSLTTAMLVVVLKVRVRLWIARVLPILGSLASPLSCGFLGGLWAELVFVCHRNPSGIDRNKTA